MECKQIQSGQSRSQSGMARTMFGLRHEDKFSHNKLTPARKHRASMDESSLCAIFEEYKVFSLTTHPDCLYNIATKDLVTEEIQCSLLNARILGQQHMSQFVEERLQSVRDRQQTQEAAGQNVEFYDPIHKNNAPTFDNLYQIVQAAKKKGKSTILRADRNVLHRLIVAYEAGRSVDLQSVLKYELMPVPIALAEMNTSLRTGQKSILADIVTQGIECPSEVELQGRSGLFIDGMALVAGIGKPHGIQTFRDYAVAFQRAVSNAGSLF